MRNLKWLAAVASAAFFIVSAHAQNAGTVTNHAFPIGKGAGIQGFTSVGPCGAGIAPVGNASADPSCQTLPVAGGGTGITTLAIGDLLQASSSTALARLAAVATGNVLLSGGVGVVSSWGKVGLTTHVSGILPLANGGTNSDLSATGGASQFLRQNTVGGSVTPIRPACADISDATVYCNAARGQLPGETSNGSATAGNIGEIISSSVLVGSAVALTSGTVANVTSISLTAGDWDVWAYLGFTGGATTTVGKLVGGISTTTGTLDQTPGRVATAYLAASGTAIFANISSSPPMNGLEHAAGRIRLSISGPTTVFLVAAGNFATSTCSAYGFIGARRAR